MTKLNILVSCTVITYNSEATVIETLESIKNQTYQNIELIVSDDGSTDNTVELCHDWLLNNKTRFANINLMTVNHNTGVASNCNRAWRATHGEWLKDIAGDDILLPNCIEDFVHYITEHPEVVWVSSYVRLYVGTFDEKNCTSQKRIISPSFFNLGAREQLHRIAYSNCLIAPSMFYKRSLKVEVGNYDEEYILEDWPYYIRILEHGYKCHLLDSVTVGYRLHESLSHGLKQFFRYDVQKKIRQFQRDKCYKYLTIREIIGCETWNLVQNLFQIFRINKETKFLSRVYYKIFNIIANFSGIHI